MGKPSSGVEVEFKRLRAWPEDPYQWRGGELLKALIRDWGNWDVGLNYFSTGRGLFGLARWETLGLGRNYFLGSQLFQEVIK